MKMDTWTQLARVQAGALTCAEFEAWLYADEQTAADLGPRWYLELMEFNYRQPNARRELQSLVERIAASRPPTELARALASGFLAGHVSLHDLAGGFAAMHRDGHHWVPASFLYLDDELLEVPHPDRHHLWDPTALVATLQAWEPDLARMRTDARAMCTDVLAYLDAGPAEPKRS
ncbi:MAG TPA: hypothetical protein VFH27_06600 [Longimicrobiaceae bacterium]|nr:hypothetical protein [Longimicrobiaceae bacterium]